MGEDSEGLPLVSQDQMKICYENSIYSKRRKGTIYMELFTFIPGVQFLDLAGERN